MEPYLNTSLALQEFNNTCVLNQYAMLDATQKLPSIAFWLSLGVVALLAFNWIVLPFLYKWKYYETLKEATPGMAFALSIWVPLILMYFTLDLTEQGFKELEAILLIVAALYFITVMIYNRGHIRDWIKANWRDEE